MNSGCKGSINTLFGCGEYEKGALALIIYISSIIYPRCSLCKRLNWNQRIGQNGSVGHMIHTKTCGIQTLVSCLFEMMMSRHLFDSDSANVLSRICSDTFFDCAASFVLTPDLSLICVRLIFDRMRLHSSVSPSSLYSYSSCFFRLHVLEDALLSQSTLESDFIIFFLSMKGLFCNSHTLKKTLCYKCWPSILWY